MDTTANRIIPPSREEIEVSQKKYSGQGRIWEILATAHKLDPESRLERHRSMDRISQRDSELELEIAVERALAKEEFEALK